MPPFEVLLASDFTARSDRPLGRAVQLAEEKRGKLAIAHVLEKGTDANDEDILHRLRADLPENAANAELIVRAGSAPKTLTAIAAERGSDLIVTGVARYNSIGDYFLGTAVDHIIRNAERPVLVVRCRPVGPYRRLVVATDLSNCSRAALLTAAALFRDAVITLVHAFHVPYEGWVKSADAKADVRAEAQEELEAFLADVDPTVLARVDARLVEGETGTVIVQEIARTEADLLVLGTHGRSGFTRATIGRQAEGLLSAVNADVLMVRECN